MLEIIDAINIFHYCIINIHHFYLLFHLSKSVIIIIIVQIFIPLLIYLSFIQLHYEFQFLIIPILFIN